TSFALGSFTDPGANDNPWSLDVNWGDATAHYTSTISSLGSLGSLNHTYGSAGTYTVTVKVTDNGSLFDSKTFTVAVANVAPTVAITGAPTSSTEGTGLVLGSSVVDPGLADTFTYAWSVTKNSAPFATGTTAS